MFKNLKFMGVLVLTVLLLTNCNKEAKQDPTALGEITFAPLDIDPDKDYDIECVEGTATHARVRISDNADGTGNPQTFYPAVFMIDGKLKTQSIKLAPGDYYLQEFTLMTDGDDAGDHQNGNHVPLKSTPMTGSPYAQYVSYSLSHLFHVVAFEKYEYWIEVLCYIPVHYEDFGFTWWEVRELTIRTQCFFGDFCIKHLPDYVGSLYAVNGLQLDEVAIFKIKAYRNGFPIGIFSNSGWDGQGNYLFDSPLCVEYADYDNEDDHFEFELWIYVKVGNVFQYKYFHTWTFDDDEMLPTGEDWVVEFVLGNCNYLPEGLVLPPYMNLPCGFEYWVTGSDSTFFTGHFSGIDTGNPNLGGGYDIADGSYGTWCADLDHTIGGGVYTMCAYSSLYFEEIPWSCDNNENDDTDWSSMQDEFGRLNWVLNNMNLFAGYSVAEFQDGIWNIMEQMDSPVNTPARDMYELAWPHENFSPLPGGYAAVVRVDLGGNCNNTQLTFRSVDP